MSLESGAINNAALVSSEIRKTPKGYGRKEKLTLHFLAI
jgi:hypothetical protein